MLIYRLITAVILIPLVIAALFFLPLPYFSFVAAILSTLGAWEWAQFTRFNSPQQRILYAAAFGLIFCVVAFLPQPLRNCVFSLSLYVSLIWWIMAFFLVRGYPKTAALWQKSTTLKNLFALVTLLPLMTGMIVLREQAYAAQPLYGATLLLYVMVLVWSTDSGAYAAGRLFGKRKLLPAVSPGKTVEGLIGGLISAAIVAVIFTVIAPLHLPFWVLCISSFIAVLVSVLGDLTESMFKRVANIKDSSQLIPGHGGVLDRVDSLTAAIPVFACILLLLL